LLASDPEIKHLSTKATALYISSLFKIRKLKISPEKLDKFAQSMGLAQLPQDALSMNLSDETEDRKRKMSPLERLKEKIRLKKLEKKNLSWRPDIPLQLL
jgi:hypothetical protein